MNLHQLSVFLKINEDISFNYDTMQAYMYILYSRKYWQELNLVVEPKITIARILADRYKILADFKFGSCNIDRQTVKFSGYTVCGEMHKITPKTRIHVPPLVNSLLSL